MPDEARLRVLHAVSGFLGALAAETPLALLLDDLHWADSASLDLLLHLARQSLGGRVLLLGTYRDVEVNRQHPLERALTDLARERLVEEISLRGLPPEGTAALIGAHFGVADLPGELAGLVHERTEGNPFFTEEVLKALVEQGAIGRTGSGWDRRKAREIEVPRNVRSVIGQRVGQLPAEVQEVLRVASILGQQWELDVLVGATGMDEAAVLDALDAAFAARLLEERRVGRREFYAFAHALMGQALYEEVPRYRLRRLHLRAGETLERLRGEQPDAWAELARHFLAAGEEERALRYSMRAGDHAARLYAHVEAIQHYRAALELLAATGAAAEVARLHERLGEALRLLGQYDAALEMLEHAAEIWEADQDLEGLARVLLPIGFAHMRRGTALQGLARVQPWIDRIDTHASPRSLVALLEGLAQLLFACGRFEEYLAATERAAAHLSTLGDARALARVTYEQGNALQLLGRIGEALQCMDEAIRLAETVGDDEYLSLALGEKAYMHDARGEFAAGERLFQRAIDLARRVGDPHLTGLNFIMRDLMFVHMGKWDEARRSLERTIGATDGTWGSAGHPLIRGSLQLSMGEWDDAARSLDEAIRLFEPYGDLQGRRGAGGMRAELDVLQGHPQSARVRLAPLLDRPGLEEFDVTYFLPVLAWADLELGDLPQAEQTIEQALRRARAEDLRLFLVDALRVRALIAIRQRRWDVAAAALEEGLSLARAMPYPYAEARMLQVRGSMHAERGKPATARECCEAALVIFRRLGARKDVERTELLLAALG